MTLPEYEVLFNVDSVHDGKKYPTAHGDKDDNPIPHGAVCRINTSRMGYTKSATRVEGTDDILHSAKRKSVNALELYQGDFLQIEKAPASGQASPAAILFATAAFCSVEYLHQGSGAKVRLLENAFLYTKHWYNMWVNETQPRKTLIYLLLRCTSDRYSQVDGIDYKLGGSPLIGGPVYVSRSAHESI